MVLPTRFRFQKPNANYPYPPALARNPSTLHQTYSIPSSSRLRCGTAGCRRCSLTSTKRGAINCSQMFRAVRVALALLSIFSIAYVLITPAATDDVTAVSQRSHFGKAQKLAVCLVQPLAPQIAIFRLPTPSSSNQRLTALELVDLFRTYRC